MSKKYFEKLAKNSATSSKEYSSAFGLKILEKFGWQKGDGLGANLDGARDCIQISRREEKVGLGGEKVNDDSDAKQWDNWWAGAYNSVAGKLGPIDNAAARTTDDKDSSDESETDNEGPSKSAIKGARVMRGKLARVCRLENKTEDAAAPAAPAPASKPTSSPSVSKPAAALPKWLASLRAWRDAQIKRLSSGSTAIPDNSSATITEAAPAPGPETEGKKKKKSKKNAAPGSTAETTKGEVQKAAEPVVEAASAEATASDAAKKKKKRSKSAVEAEEKEPAPAARIADEEKVEKPKKKKKTK